MEPLVPTFDITYLMELIDSIENESAAKHWSSVESDLTSLADQLLAALSEADESTVRAVYERVEQAFSVMATRSSPGDDSLNESKVTAELHAFTRLLEIAQHRRPSPAELLKTLGNTDQRILMALLEAEETGLAGYELAAVLKVAPETVARRLPILRELDLVEWQRVGKATINTLGSGVREALLAKVRARPVPAPLGTRRTNTERARPARSRRNAR
jgi:DNA-binding transcriptional ArsR family regulator